VTTTLRDYQRAAIDGLYSWFEEKEGNPLIVVPTGGGKSIIIAEFIREVLQLWPGERLMVVTHVKELIDQNHRALLRGWPDAPAGIYSAGLGRRDSRAKVLFAGVQSVYRRAQEIGWVDLVLVDEAHLIPARGFGMYRTLLAELRQINPDVKLVGFTATPFRTDSGSLDTGDDRMFHGVAYNTEIAKLIDDGWLSNITNQGVADEAEIDTRGVHTQMGEFVARELEEAATKEGLVEAACDELIARAGDRKGWLVFCCGLDHAGMVSDVLNARGIPCETVFGDTHRDDRDRIIRAFRAGELRAIANVGVLTTGFDAPHTDVIALMRPTQSPGLYVQMVGRGMRIAPEKQDCLVLDFGGNIERHGPIDQVNVREPKASDGDGEPPVKKCPKCQRYVATAFVICPGCGFEFPINRVEPNHDYYVDDQSALLSGQKPKVIERWKVDRVVYSEHVKAGAAPDHPHTLRVTYFCGWKRTVSEWVCFEHKGFARAKAVAWWCRRGGKDPAPETVDLARVRIELGEILAPVEVAVDTRPKWPEIKGVKLEDENDHNELEAIKEEAQFAPKNPPPDDYLDIPF
jgi:DNA repair protein RadD